MDNLESLSLMFPTSGTNTGYDSNHPFTSNIRLFDGACNVHIARVTAGYDLFHPNMLHLPWSQLTGLDFEDTTLPSSFNQTHTVLRQCVNLQSLRIGIADDDKCGISRLNTLLPHLESMTVFTFNMTVDWNEYGRFLRPFVLPSLKHLEIVSCFGKSVWPEEAPHVFKPCCLQNLECLEAQQLEPAAVLVFLEAVPLLCELSLPSFKSKDGLEDLAPFIGDGDVVPLLRKLEWNVDDLDWLIVILERRTKTDGGDNGDKDEN